MMVPQQQNIGELKRIEIRLLFLVVTGNVIEYSWDYLRLGDRNKF